MDFFIKREFIKGCWEWRKPDTLTIIEGLANFYIDKEEVSPQEFAE